MIDYSEDEADYSIIIALIFLCNSRLCGKIHGTSWLFTKAGGCQGILSEDLAADFAQGMDD